MGINLLDLNKQQRLAVEEINGPCMVIAGAGSGKTRVLTYKIAYLLEKNVHPYNILALTFTNKAANEMKERILNLVGEQARALWMGTFHSVFARILRHEAESLGFTRNYTIYDTDDSIAIIKKIMDEMNISDKAFNPKLVHSYISHLKNKLILPADFSTMVKTYFEKTVEPIYKEYQDRLRINNAMDFDDLLIKPIELFNSDYDVLLKYQSRFKYILVDEYQDTNRAQYILLKQLSALHKNISVVGDDAQSIYRWRGAEINNIFDFQNEFSNVSLIRLEQNYRSTKKILQLADLIIQNNKRQIKKTLWTDNPEGESVTLIENLTDKQEAESICKFIAHEIHTRKLLPKDFAVLYRTNAQSRILEEAFRNNGIPYIIVGGIKFYQRKEIKDILAHLRIIINPADTEALIRVLNFQEGIGKATINKLISLAKVRDVKLYDVITHLAEEREIPSRTKNLLLKLLEFIHKGRFLLENASVSEAVRELIDEIKIIDQLKEEGTEEAQERIENVKEFVSAVAEFEERTQGTLEDFLQQVSLLSDIDEVESVKNAVMLMTIHSAKGLEFPVVFVTGLEEGLFPVSSSNGSLEESEEERRLFYVATTRAKEKLYLSYCLIRRRFGEIMPQIKSRFLKEIEESALSQGIIEISRKNVSSYLFPEKESNKNGRKNRRKKTSVVHYHDKNSDDVFGDIQAGVNVVHNVFGKGKVISTQGKGENKRAVIIFDEVGTKTIVLKYAKMQVFEIEN